MLNINNYSLICNKKVFISIEQLQIVGGSKVNIFANNDTGKSLFLRSVHGDYRKYKGEIKIKEKSAKFYLKRKKTILLESLPHILPQETVWKNIVLPLPTVSLRQKQKITDLCNIAGLTDKITFKGRNVSYSALKFIELIRAVVQLPYLILLDDFDTFFDRGNYLKALKIFDYVLDNGAIVLATSREKLNSFDEFYSIRSNEMEKV